MNYKGLNSAIIFLLSVKVLDQKLNGSLKDRLDKKETFEVGLEVEELIQKKLVS